MEVRSPHSHRPPRNILASSRRLPRMLYHPPKAPVRTHPRSSISASARLRVAVACVMSAVSCFIVASAPPLLIPRS
jgi:hypothetical protein